MESNLICQLLKVSLTKAYLDWRTLHIFFYHIIYQLAFIRIVTPKKKRKKDTRLLSTLWSWVIVALTHYPFHSHFFLNFKHQSVSTLHYVYWNIKCMWYPRWYSVDLSMKTTKKINCKKFSSTQVHIVRCLMIITYILFSYVLGYWLINVKPTYSF